MYIPFDLCIFPMHKKGFTLLEVIVAVTSFFLLLTVITTTYLRMITLKYNIQARTNVTQDSYYAIEKINLLLKDYTIDYEEYFNRKNVGCNGNQENFSRNVDTGGYCTNFTAYGNNNNIDQEPSSERKIYFCSSTTEETTPQHPQRIIKNTEVKD